MSHIRPEISQRGGKRSMLREQERAQKEAADRYAELARTGRGDDVQELKALIDTLKRSSAR